MLVYVRWHKARSLWGSPPNKEHTTTSLSLVGTIVFYISISPCLRVKLIGPGVFDDTVHRSGNVYATINYAGTRCYMSADFFSRRGLGSDRRALGVARAKLAKDAVEVTRWMRTEHLQNVKNVQLWGSSPMHICRNHILRSFC